MQEEKIKIRTIFNDATKLREALENYFIHCKEFDEVPTKIGMLVYLDRLFSLYVLLLNFIT